MKVKTGLPHEENGAISLALFGKPYILSSSKNSIHIDCSIIIDTQKASAEDYNSLALAPVTKNLPEATVKKMYSHAKSIVRQFIKDKKKAWSIVRENAVYFQDGHWRGFYFRIRK